MRNFFIFFALLIGCLLFSISDVLAVTNIQSSNTYYYSLTCSHCRKVDDFFVTNGIVEKFNITKKEISQNPTNAKEFFDLLQSRGIPPEQMGVPYLDFGSLGYMGDKEIIGLFNDLLDENKIDADNSSNSGEPVSQPSANSMKELTFGAVLIAALADSVNPCAFSVIIFLMISLLAVGNKKRALKIGLVYVLTVYLVYLLAGLGLLSALQWLSFISRYIMYASAFLAILAGLINIKDFFWYGKGITLAIPESKKPLIERYIKYGSIPSAIVLGFLVALFELPCTGGFYLAILSLLAIQTTFIVGLMYLIVYNLIFVLPLLVIVLLVYFGWEPKKMEQFRNSNRKWLRLIMGLVLILLGLSLIFLF